MSNRLCMNCKPCKDQLDIDCDDCKAKVRAEAIEEFKDLGKLYSEIRAEAIDKILTHTQAIVDEDGIIHEVVLVKDIEKLKEKK